MTHLDPKGIEAAYETLGMPDHPDQRRPIEPAIRAYLSAERAAHAETKRKRDDASFARAYANNEWRKDYNELAVRAEAYKAQRDEALKALDEADAIIEEMVAAENEWQCNPEDDERIASVQSRASVYLATRRVREGGKVE